MLLAEFGTGQVFWSIVWFSLFFLWIWLVVMIFTDLFRSPDLSGWGKAAWAVFLIVSSGVHREKGRLLRVLGEELLALPVKLGVVLGHPGIDLHWNHGVLGEHPVGQIG